MYDNIITFWFFLFFLGLIPINYFALMAIDFSKIFKANSTWQIRTLVLFASLISSFLIAFMITTVLERLLFL